MKKLDITKLARKNILELKPYVAARQENSSGTLLDANENPYGMVNRYPDPYAKDLREAIASYLGVEAEQIFSGNGSDEIIDLLIRIFCEPGKDEIVILPPTFGMYETYAAMNNVGVRAIPLSGNFQLRLEETIEESKGAKIIFLCSPNNPTANCLDNDSILTLLKEFEGLVVVDEAYIEFSERASMLSLVEKYENLLVLRTLSKSWGAAGLRIGYAIASSPVLALLRKVKPPYNIGALNQKEAVEILKNERAMIYTRSLILNERERMEKSLAKLGLRVFPSQANFILFQVPQASRISRRLAEQGVILRDKSSEIENALRVSVGKQDENDGFLRGLSACLKKVAFIDRDGILIFEPQDDFQVDSLEKYQILPGAMSAMQKLKKAGYELIMVSNQNGIGSESFPEEDFLLVQNKLISDLAEQGIKFGEIFICPHFLSDGCKCRKPLTGLVDDYLANTPINYAESIMVGDRDTDLKFAENIRVRGYKGLTNTDCLNRIVNQLLP